jgi:hypothetical protein
MTNAIKALLLELPTNQEAPLFTGYCLHILILVIGYNKNAQEFLAGGGIQLVPNLLNMATNQSLKRSNFVGLIFEFLNLLISQTGDVGAKQMYSMAPEIGDVLIDIIHGHIDSDENEYVLQSGLNFLG